MRLASSVRRALPEAGDRPQRKRAEEALRRSEMYLAEAQTLSHTGGFEKWRVTARSGMERVEECAKARGYMSFPGTL